MQGQSAHVGRHGTRGQGHIQSIHVRPPTLVARLVTMQACAVSALSTEPPLKPARGRRSESGSGGEGEGEGATYQRKTSVNAHPCKKNRRTRTPSARRSSCLPQFGKILVPPSLPPSSSCPCAPAHPCQAPLHPSSPSSSAACPSIVPDACAAGAGVPGGHGGDESAVVVGPVGRLFHTSMMCGRCARGAWSRCSGIRTV